jgi:hypothetical protein
MTDKCKISATLRIELVLMIERMNLRRWLILAAHPATVRRAGLTSLLVGTVLVTINHGPAIIAAQLTSERIFQMLLTYLVPYLVSTTSSILTRNELRSAAASGFRARDTLFHSASHRLNKEGATIILPDSSF